MLVLKKAQKFYKKKCGLRKILMPVNEEILQEENEGTIWET